MSVTWEMPSWSFDESRVIPLFEAWDPGLQGTEAPVAAPALPAPAVQPWLPTSLPSGEGGRKGPFSYATRLRIRTP